MDHQRWLWVQSLDNCFLTQFIRGAYLFGFRCRCFDDSYHTHTWTVLTIYHDYLVLICLIQAYFILLLCPVFGSSISYLLRIFSRNELCSLWCSIRLTIDELTYGFESPFEWSQRYIYLYVHSLIVVALGDDTFSCGSEQWWIIQTDTSSDQQLHILWSRLLMSCAMDYDAVLCLLFTIQYLSFGGDYGAAIIMNYPRISSWFDCEWSHREGCRDMVLNPQYVIPKVVPSSSLSTWWQLNQLLTTQSDLWMITIISMFDESFWNIGIFYIPRDFNQFQFLSFLLLGSIQFDDWLYVGISRNSSWAWTGDQGDCISQSHLGMFHDRLYSLFPDDYLHKW